ncbi:hypothetical protein PN836_008775 [Ningiella sp. W23]|uniref:hypothetical protein n=1 Tax=Ningiella sp. W23 TaxID=3023715 RepID=UPI00375686C7
MIDVQRLSFAYGKESKESLRPEVVDISFYDNQVHDPQALLAELGLEAGSVALERQAINTWNNLSTLSVIELPRIWKRRG